MSKADGSVPSNVQEFIKSKKILILEPSSSFSNSIQQILLKMGSAHENIFREASFERALIAIKEKPEIIISEYQIGHRFGLELAAMQQEYLDNPGQRIFIMATSNSNDSNVAEAAEEEVDAYILKPFTLGQFQEILQSVLHRKASPSPYSLKIQEGKALQKEGKDEEALKFFKEAKSMTDKPSLAYCYEGTILSKLNRKDEALKSFEEGLKHNPVHYKCLQGKFDILFEKEDREEAYKVIKTINENFPISPATLEKMATLAIFTNHFEDLDRYYESFLKLDRRSERLTKVMTEAMFFSGRYFLKKKNSKRALESLKKASTASKRDPKFLERVVTALLKDQHVNEAEVFLEMFPFEARETPKFLQMEFQVGKAKLPPHELITKGKKLIDEGTATPDICNDVIKLLMSQDKATMAEQAAFKAAQLFPDFREKFYAILKVS
ncbi:MAG TPA: hypothetical protein DCL41_06165 [Bdellovibrionales bacterium]|nr:hypothetical protein [Pseudobdellovibrionaceae bacterium]HAG91434.1 hypothetical protein [Bdellovibrionales bacterium]|tara:strand:- start:14675 stop:15988 length:1314 start_codon:yes stop_codon:yes gene_type:complete